MSASIILVVSSAIAIFFCPITNDAWRSSWPKMPGDSSRPYTLALMLTCVPAGQYSRGRHSTSCLFVQLHDPSTAGTVVTVSARSAISLLTIGSSNRMPAMYPTP
jgi:hypothetical protein